MEIIIVRIIKLELIMSRYNLRKLQEKHKKAVLNEFYSAVASLRNKREAEKFFSDLLDLNEIGMLARRLLAAEKLEQGKTFEVISQELKMGMDTIGRVSRWLEDGEGYKLVISRLKKNKRK